MQNQRETKMKLSEFNKSESLGPASWQNGNIASIVTPKTLPFREVGSP